LYTGHIIKWNKLSSLRQPKKNSKSLNIRMFAFPCSKCPLLFKRQAFWHAHKSKNKNIPICTVSVCCGRTTIVLHRNISGEIFMKIRSAVFSFYAIKVADRQTNEQTP